MPPKTKLVVVKKLFWKDKGKLRSYEFKGFQLKKIRSIQQVCSWSNHLLKTYTLLRLPCFPDLLQAWKRFWNFTVGSAIKLLQQILT